MLFEPRRLAIALAAVCAFLGLYVTQAMLPALRLEFHTGVQTVALTVMASTLAVALAAPLAGAISQHYGQRRVLLVSAALLGATTLGAATAHSLAELIVWRFAEGLFIPGIFTSAVAYIAEEWPGRETPAVTALFTAGAVLGSFVGRYLGGALTQFYGWPTAFVALGALTLTLTAALARVLRRERNFAAGGGLAASLRGLAKVAGNRRLLATCAIGFGTLFCQVATFTYISFHLAAAPYLLDTHQLGEVVAVFLIGMVATPFAGRLAQRYGTLRLLRVGLLAGAGGMLLTLAQPLPVILAGL
ncbi:MAG: MFS transporter, partial [Gammaproteobacteria bacterium]|nr:MFS transporter [Gammaproteobacteria bacterium]